MERHKCKLCFRTFANGRALGGHMKAHLAAFPLPPKTAPQQQQQLESASSSSYSSSGEEQQQGIKERQELVEDQKSSLVYGLRENPKKSFRLADPEFSFVVDAGSVVVQDRESETESRNPTRRRSKRARKSGFGENQKHNFDSKNQTWVESSPASSVYDTSPEEDVAMSLMMLSRDVWTPKNGEEQEQQREQATGDNNKYKEKSVGMEIVKKSKIRGKFRCEKCTKLFRSSQALGGHKRICPLHVTEAKNAASKGEVNERIFECPYCSKVFGSGQALGGHKRSHLMSSSSPATTTAAAAAAAAAENCSAAKVENNFIDLNMPAPIEDDEFSVVSDA